MNAPLLRRIASITLVAFTTVCLTPVAQAGMIPTAQVLTEAASAAPRDRLTATLARDEVRAALVERGVDPAMVDARVAALSDEEVATLEARIDTLPAGGDVLGILLTIFVVLLITDLLGWTHVFPFTNKGSVN